MYLGCNNEVIQICKSVNKTQLILQFCPFFYRGCSRESSGPVPNLEPVSPVSPDKEQAPGQQKWFHSSTKSLLGQKEQTAYIRVVDRHTAHSY